MSARKPKTPRRTGPIHTHDIATESRKADEALRQAMAAVAQVAMERRAIVKKC